MSEYQMPRAPDIFLRQIRQIAKAVLPCLKKAVRQMFLLLIIVILLTLALMMATHKFLQTRKRRELLVMIGLAAMIAIIAIPWLLIFLGIGTNIE